MVYERRDYLMLGCGHLPPSGFGARLHAVREARDMTRKQSGDLAATHVTTIARFKRGEHERKRPLVWKLTSVPGWTAFAGTLASAGKKPTQM